MPAGIIFCSFFSAGISELLEEGFRIFSVYGRGESVHLSELEVLDYASGPVRGGEPDGISLVSLREEDARSGIQSGFDEKACLILDVYRELLFRLYGLVLPHLFLGP